MRIVWISHSAAWEGAEQALAEAVQGLSKKEIELHVIVPSQGKLVSVLEKIGVTVHVIYHPWWVNELKYGLHPIKRLFQYVKATLTLIQILKYIKPQLVVTNTLVVPCGAFASKMLGIPHVWYIHEFLEEDHGLTLEIGIKASLFFVDCLSKSVIVNSVAVYKKFKKNISEVKIKTTYYAVETLTEINEYNKIKLDNSSAFHVALIGRKAPGKRQEDAIRALSILINNDLDVQLWLVGGDSGDYTDYLRKLAQDLRVSARVEFISFVDNPALYMRSADVTLMCSSSEAFGRVTIEAMKLGKAVVGSDCGATSELIRDGWNGLLYPADRADKLAEKIELLYSNESLRRKIELNAYKWSNDKFNLEKYTSDLLSVFEGVIKDSK